MSGRGAARAAAAPGPIARRTKPCITVIGGAGAMGRITVRDLVETAPSGVDIVLADRDPAAARAVVRALPAAKRRRVRTVAVDAARVEATARALRGTTVLINACHHSFNLRVMQVALACGSHYCDLGGLFHVTRQQLRLHRTFARAGLLAICGMGSAPGIVNVMARAAADSLDEVTEVHIAVGTVAGGGAPPVRADTPDRARAAQPAAVSPRAARRAVPRAVRGAAPAAGDATVASAEVESRSQGVAQPPSAGVDAPELAVRTPRDAPLASTAAEASPSPLATSYSIDTILDEASQPAALFTNGALTFVEPLSGASAVDFPAPVGRQYPARTLHSELATLPQFFAGRGVREVSFRIAFAGDLMERLRFLHRLGLTDRRPLRVGAARVAPRDLLLALLARPRAAASAPPSSSPAAATPDEYEVLRVTVRGREAGRDVEIVSDCYVPGIPAWRLGVDVDTGCPPSIVAQMILRGAIDARGVLPPERAVPPEPFFRGLAQRGMTITQRR